MYGTITGSTATPNTRTSARREVYDVTNSSGDYSYQLTGGLTKRFDPRWEGSLFYTYTQSRDIQSTGNSTAGSNFGLGRIMSGGSLLDKSDIQRSRWEIPHRIIATGTLHAADVEDGDHDDLRRQLGPGVLVLLLDRRKRRRSGERRRVRARATCAT